jgi:hypothetical protein
MDKLSIQNEMACFDRKDRGFYDDLTDEERKKFSNYLMIRWGSAVTGSRELQEFYVIATNERLNRHFFALGQHPKLQWLLATTVSPGLGSQRHQWIPPKKRDAGDSGNTRKRLAELFPAMKLDDIATWAQIITKKELQQYERDHGN